MGITHVQLPWQQLSVLELQQLTGVRGGIWLCYCAVTMAKAVNAGAATAGVRDGVGLCSCATSMITLVIVAVATSESWNTYMVNDHLPS